MKVRRGRGAAGRAAALALAAALLAGVAPAAPAHAAAAADPRAAVTAAYADAMTVAMPGPGTIALPGGASLRLPGGDIYVPPAQAGALIRALGNRPANGLVGVVLPAGLPPAWLAELHATEVGRIDDGDAAALTPDAALAALRAAAAARNPGRIERKLPPLDVTGWIAPPAYDAARHVLTWSTLLTEPGAAVQPDASYQARLLTANGVLGIDLLAGREQLRAAIPVADGLMASLTLPPAQRYAAGGAAGSYTLASLMGITLEPPAAPAPARLRAAMVPLGFGIAGAALLALWLLRRRRPAGGPTGAS